MLAEDELSYDPSVINLEERLQFETLLTDVSSKFVNLPADKIDIEIETVLQRITEALDIDRCSVAQFTDDLKKLIVTHAYAVPGVSPMPDMVLNEHQPWYTHRLYQCRTIVMESVRDLPDEAIIEKRHCRNEGIQSSVLIPMAVGGSFLGVVGFACLKNPRKWPDFLVKRLKMLGMVFANAIMRKTSELKLRQAFSEIQYLKDKLEAENIFLREEISLRHQQDEFIAESECIKDVLVLAGQVARMDTTVLILGETGTGKELLAKAIHTLSLRRQHTMVTVNCAALPSNLVESELFGHEKGAFTGAESRRIGRFELADKSTLFLDEIGELSLSLQAKLLRVLQEKKFERLGGHKSIASDVRVIAATNRNLLQAVKAGEFRSDLYYRLNVFPIIIPPLRERRSDIPALVWFFVRHFSEKMGKRIDRISNAAMDTLCQNEWPGNVRELRNVVERAMIITKGRSLQISLPAQQQIAADRPATLDAIQKRHIIATLETTSWCVRGEKGAAKILGMKPTTLESRMSKLGIVRPGK